MPPHAFLVKELSEPVPSVQDLSLPVLSIRLKWHRRIPKEGPIEQCESTNQVTNQC